MNTEKSIKDLKLAYNERGVLTLLEYAEKGQDYYLDEGLTIPLLIAEGSVNRKHFRRFPNIDVQVIRDYFGSSESIEHLNAKRQILYSKSIQIGSVIIQGHTAKDEVRFLDTNNIIDVVLYDEKGNVLLGIEVYHTNKKDKESMAAIKKYWYLPILVFAGSGLIEVLLFYVQKSGKVGDGGLNFTSVLFFLSGCLGLIFLIVIKQVNFTRNEIIAGICIGVHNFFTIYLLIRGLELGWDGSVLFPVNNVGTIFFTAVIGILIFKEKLTKINYLGLVVAILAVYLISQ